MKTYQICSRCGRRTSFPNKNHNLKCVICGKYFCSNSSGPKQTCSEECKKKLYLKNNPFCASSPFRKKINEKLKGRHLTKEQRQHLSEIRKGKPNLKLRGRRLNKEIREKLSSINKSNQNWKRRQKFGCNLEEHNKILEEELSKIPLTVVRTDKVRPDAILIDWEKEKIYSLEIELSNPYAKRRLYEENNNFGFDLVIIKGRRDGKIETYYELRKESSDGRENKEEEKEA